MPYKVFKNLSEAACHFRISQHTIWNWQKETHGPASKAQKKRRLLSDDQEQVLCNWILFSAEIGEAMSKHALQVKAAEMSKTLQDKSKKKHKKHIPSECWVYRFLEQNSWLALKQPTGLNAVHAQNFDPAVVS